jgi:thiol-disulfide isomerase/thioredoxin
MFPYLLRIGLTAVLVLTVVGSALAAQTPARAPDFLVYGTNIDEPRMLSEYRGKVVYVDFWASWCAPCRQSFPFMNELHAQYADDGLVVVGINLDEEREAARRFLEQVPAHFPIVYNPEGDLAEKYAVKAMPSSYVVGPDGRIVHRKLGFRLGEREEMERLIARQLERVK